MPCFACGLVQSLHTVSFHSSRNEWSSIKSQELDFTALFIICSVIFHLPFLLQNLNELFPILEQLLKLHSHKNLCRNTQMFPQLHH